MIVIIIIVMIIMILKSTGNAWTTIKLLFFSFVVVFLGMVYKN